MVGLRLWTIFLGGFVLAIILQFFIVSLFGDPAALLQVGETSSVAPFIKSELGEDIPTFPNLGHDGQASYVIARQPFGGDVAASMGTPAFRYRRWLYPAIAGGLGMFSARATVVGLAVWSAIGFGLAVAALVVIGETYGVRSRFLALGVYLNVGLALSTVLVTSDALGLGLSLAGVAAYRRNRPLVAVILLAAAAITKEQFLIFAGAVAVDAWAARDRSAALSYLLIPVGFVAAITVVVTAAFGGSAGLGSNLAPPLSGIVQASRGWPSSYATLRMASYITLAGLVLVGPLALWSRERLVILMSAGWMAAAVLAGEVVWKKGTDSIRVFAALLPLICLALAIVVARSRGHQGSANPGDPHRPARLGTDRPSELA